MTLPIPNDPAAATSDAAASDSEPETPVRADETGPDSAQLLERIAELEREKQALTARVFSLESDLASPRGKRVRPAVLRGITYKKRTPLGEMFVNITEDERGHPFEVFINLGKAGGSAMADAEALGRVISLALRSGVPLMAIHKQIRGISSDRAVGFGANRVLSMPDGVAIAIADWHAERTEGVQESLPLESAAGPAHVPADEQGSAPPVAFAPQVEQFHGTCPDCGAGVVMDSGCVHCSSNECGWAECG